MADKVHLVAPEEKCVQACISAVSFPDSRDEVLSMVGKNSWFRRWETDMDALLNPDGRTWIGWTVPKWFTTGDILFLYHTKSAKKRIAHLQKKLQVPRRRDQILTRLLPSLASDEHRLYALLEHAARLADQYAGTIFACGRVDGPAEYYDGYDPSSHFHGRIFAKIADVHIFKQPLSYDEFTKLVRLNRQAASTPLKRGEFNAIRERLGEKNELPRFLQHARLGDRGFRGINQKNWRSISCDPDTRFIHETQLREYLIDFLLQELKDEGMPFLEECQCYRDGGITGLADYFVKVGGRWIPVEAKVNIVAERDLPTQIRKYIHVESFTPTKGSHAQESFYPGDSALSLVVDQGGVYLASEGEFKRCGSERPLWTRTELGEPDTVEGIRQFLCSAVDED
jgi:hypothetical protein